MALARLAAWLNTRRNPAPTTAPKMPLARKGAVASTRPALARRIAHRKSEGPRVASRAARRIAIRVPETAACVCRALAPARVAKPRLTIDKAERDAIVPRQHLSASWARYGNDLWRVHDSPPIEQPTARRCRRESTPAIEAGLTDHGWSMAELLWWLHSARQAPRFTHSASNVAKRGCLRVHRSA